MNSKTDLAELVNRLIKGELEERIKAGIAIRELGDEAVGTLLELLANPENHNFWWLIADALGAIGDNRAVEPLIELLKSPMSFDAILGCVDISA